MIPLRDSIRSKTTPYINYFLIALCGMMFLYETSLGGRLEGFVQTFSVVPHRVAITFYRGQFSPAALYPLITSLFLHGGWMHLIGNMLYLYIFGDNVEDRLGHFGYLIFYLLCGAGASLVEVYSAQESVVPLLGASGAIAGVLGAYFILFPGARVLTMIPLFVFFPVVEVSAFLFLGFWFVMQFLAGSFAAGAGAAGGRVAWWAHAGGFVVGAILLPVFLVARQLKQ